MKKAIAFSLSIMSSMALAGSNGGNLIGLSPASQAMGGSGVANFTNGVDAIYKNPALMTDGLPTGKVTAEFYGTYFNQNATAASANGSTGAAVSGPVSSQSKGRLAPELAATYKYNDNLAVGIGILGFGGAVADYTGQTTAPSALSLSQLQTSLGLTRIAPAVSYRIIPEVTLGLSPFLTYGEFQINNDVETGTQTTRAKHGATGVGIQGGGTVKLGEAFLVGVTFVSKQKLTYKELLDLDKFSFPPSVAHVVDDLVVEQPTEFAAGASYKLTPDLSVTADYRFINWKKAAGYADLGWEDQHVFGGGAAYKMDKLTLRVGYQYAKSPIGDGDDGNLQSTGVQGHNILNVSRTKLNLIAFPGIAEHHITLGGGYQLNEAFGFDLAFVYSPKKSVSRTGTAGVPYKFTAEVSQWSISAGAAYRF